MTFGENKSRLIQILISFISSPFENYNFCNVKFSPGLLRHYLCHRQILNRLSNNSPDEFRINPDAHKTMKMTF